MISQMRNLFLTNIEESQRKEFRFYRICGFSSLHYFLGHSLFAVTMVLSNLLIYVLVCLYVFGSLVLARQSWQVFLVVVTFIISIANYISFVSICFRKNKKLAYQMSNLIMLLPNLPVLAFRILGKDSAFWPIAFVFPGSSLLGMIATEEHSFYFAGKLFLMTSISFFYVFLFFMFLNFKRNKKRKNYRQSFADFFSEIRQQNQQCLNKKIGVYVREEDQKIFKTRIKSLTSKDIFFNYFSNFDFPPNLTFSETIDLLIFSGKVKNSHLQNVDTHLQSLKLTRSIFVLQFRFLNQCEIQSLKLLLIILVTDEFFIIHDHLIAQNLGNFSDFYFLNNVVVLTSKKENCLLFDRFFKYEPGKGFSDFNGRTFPNFLILNEKSEKHKIEKVGFKDSITCLSDDFSYNSLQTGVFSTEKKSGSDENILSSEEDFVKNEDFIEKFENSNTAFSILSGAYTLCTLGYNSSMHADVPSNYLMITPIETRLFYNNRKRIGNIFKNLEKINDSEKIKNDNTNLIEILLKSKLKLVRKFWILLVTPVFSFFCFVLYFKATNSKDFEDPDLIYKEISIANFYSITNFNMLFAIESLIIRKNRSDKYLISGLGRIKYWVLHFLSDYAIFLLQNSVRLIFLALLSFKKRFSRSNSILYLFLCFQFIVWGFVYC